jgi:hypothetical protein
MNVLPEAEPDYSTTERSVLKSWRKCVCDLMAARIVAHSTLKPQTRTPTVRASLPSTAAADRHEHEVFKIYELLDNILEVAGPEV